MQKKTDRGLYTKDPVEGDISKIVITHGDITDRTTGNKTFKIYGVTLNVYSTAELAEEQGTGDISSQTNEDVQANSEMTFTRPEGVSWTDCYYGIAYTFTNTATFSEYNSYILIKQIDFYTHVYEYYTRTDALDEGDYVVTYDDYYALTNTATEGGLDYTAVTVKNNMILDPDPSILWHIGTADDGEHYQIYNGESNVFVATDEADGQALLLTDEADDRTLWSAEAETMTYCFGSEVGGDNAYLGFGERDETLQFARHSRGAETRLSLYKQTDTLPAPPATCFPVQKKRIEAGSQSTQKLLTTSDGSATYSLLPGDTELATIDEATGKVTALGEGTVSIVATTEETSSYYASTAEYELTITAATEPDHFASEAMEVKTGGTIACAVAGAAAYASADETVASVDEATGLVTGQSVGQTIITATLSDGGTMSCTVTVYDDTTPLFRSAAKAIVAELGGKYYAITSSAGDGDGTLEAVEVSLTEDENGSPVVIAPYSSGIAWLIEGDEDAETCTIRSCSADGTYLNHSSLATGDELAVGELGDAASYWQWDDSEDICLYSNTTSGGNTKTHTLLLRHDTGDDTLVFGDYSIKQCAGMSDETDGYEYSGLAFLCDLRHAYERYEGTAEAQTFLCIDADPCLANNAVAVMTVPEFDAESVPQQFQQADNVIVNGEATSLRLTDLTDYYAPLPYTSESVTYSRYDTACWNSVCLPFDFYSYEIPEFFGEGSKAFLLSGLTTEGTQVYATFAEVGSAEATGNSYTVTCNSTGTDTNGNATVSETQDIIASGAEYMTVTSASYIYLGKSGYGIKCGTNAGAGDITFATTDEGKVCPHYITLSASKWDADADFNVIAYVNGTEVQTITLSDTFEDYRISLDGETELSTLRLAGDRASGAQFYLRALTVSYGDGDHVEAGTPMLVLCDEDSEGWDFTASNRLFDIVGEPAGNATAEGLELQGAFRETEITGNSTYKLTSDGSQFGKAAEGSLIYPFRIAATLETTYNVNAINVELALNGEDDLADTVGRQIEWQQGQEQAIYDMLGRRIYKAALPGIYIIDGKKRVIK